jgi:hypothetical protein
MDTECNYPGISIANYSEDFPKNILKTELDIEKKSVPLQV